MSEANTDFKPLRVVSPALKVILDEIGRLLNDREGPAACGLIQRVCEEFQIGVQLAYDERGWHAEATHIDGRPLIF